MIRGKVQIMQNGSWHDRYFCAWQLFLDPNRPLIDPSLTLLRSCISCIDSFYNLQKHCCQLNWTLDWKWSGTVTRPTNHRYIYQLPLAKWSLCIGSEAWQWYTFIHKGRRKNEQVGSFLYQTRWIWNHAISSAAQVHDKTMHCITDSFMLDRLLLHRCSPSHFSRCQL